MNDPLVSIIIPVFNRENLIRRALDSVLCQTYDNWECIVVDDGSTDSTVSIVENYVSEDSRYRFKKRKLEPKGAPTCRNIGISIANGEYAIFLDSDDYLMPYCIEKRISFLKINTDHVFLVFPMAKKEKNEILKQEIPKSEDYLIDFLSAKLPWAIMCPIWKIEFLRQLNGFTLGYQRFNDPDLMIRALLQPGISFMVFSDEIYDTVYYPSPKDECQFPMKVYQSLYLLIPDVVKNLDKYGKLHLRFFLNGYLHLWFKYIFIPSKSNSFRPSLRLIHLFRKFDLISANKYFELILRFFLYQISRILFGKPVNKLSDRGFYLNSIISKYHKYS